MAKKGKSAYKPKKLTPMDKVDMAQTGKKSFRMREMAQTTDSNNKK